MSGALLFSFIFHAVVLVICIKGLPHIRKDIPMMAEPMVVELAKIDEISKIDKKPMAPEEPPVKKAAQQLSEAPPKPVFEEPPKVEDKTPPKPAEPVKPEKPDDLAPPAKEKPKPKPEVKPKPPEKKPPPKKEETAKKEEDFKSLLKNLTPDETKPVDPVKTAEKGDKPTPPAPFADQITMSELDSLRRQLSQCWGVMSGAKFAEDLVVDIKLTVNPDRTIRDAVISDQLRYMSDSYFRAAADSAVRAVRDPRCNPLDLPPEKYDLWKSIIITFDPRQIL